MRAFSVGPVRIDPPVVLAPMEGVTDRPFRTLVRSLGGCGLAVTEFVSSEAMTRDVQRAWRMAELDPDEHPVSIQIYGRDPTRMAQAARFCQELGADIVDINLGCPSKAVTSGCAGSALMREPALARDIFRAVADAITVPLTVKMRLGWDDDALNAPEVAAEAVACGARMITVHGRTKQQGYRGAARWQLVRPVRDAIGDDIPLLVNGDIVGPESAREAIAQSGATGVMIGRGVMTDPWALRRVTCDWRGEAFVEPSVEDRRVAMQAYLDRVEAGGEPTRYTLNKVKGVVHYFTKGLWKCTLIREWIHAASTFAACREAVDRYFEELARRAESGEDVVMRGVTRAREKTSARVAQARGQETTPARGQETTPARMA